MTRLEKAQELRARTDVHFNCCQSVLVTYAKEMGLTEEQAFALGSHFGSGMRCGSVCGTLTGALMVLGMTGYDEAQSASFLRQFREEHGDVSCAALLKAAFERGEEKKPHCDRMVRQCVDFVCRETGLE